MPLYEYECDACGHRFEMIQKFSDPPLDDVPEVRQGPVHKLLSSPAIQFKGTRLVHHRLREEVGSDAGEVRTARAERRRSCATKSDEGGRRARSREHDDRFGSGRDSRRRPSPRRPPTKSEPTTQPNDRR